MSATIDVDHFSKYFNKCEIFYLSGRAFPVRVVYNRKKNLGYAQSCLSTLFQIHRSAPAGYV